jgi:hypothetical protein
MGYYIRVLAEKKKHIPVSQIQSWLLSAGLANIAISVEDGDQEAWNQITLRGIRGKELVTIERNPVDPGSLGEDELHEFLAEIPGAKPKSAAEWLVKYLPRVRVIYAFQILFGGRNPIDWQPIQVVYDGVHEKLRGIYQADYEGFWNRQGFQILWQYSDHARGIMNMALLTKLGLWWTFQMDLKNLEHRKSFQEGRVPRGIIPNLMFDF